MRSNFTEICHRIPISICSSIIEVSNNEKGRRLRAKSKISEKGIALKKIIK